MTAPLVEARGLSRWYRGGRRGLLGRRDAPIRAVDGVDFEIRAGRNLAVVGESGCGKSTLARLVMALEPPTAGAVLHGGRDPATVGPAALRAMRRGFQMVFQDPYGSLDPRLKVGESVGDPLAALGGVSRAELQGRVRETLDAVGLRGDTADRYPHEFSGGQRQRIAIARAIITRPALVVADEPVSALDVSIQAQVLNLLLDLQDSHGVTYLFISHNLAVVRHVAHEVAVMYQGRIVEAGPAAPTFGRPLHPYTRALLDAVPVPGEGRSGRSRRAERAASGPPPARGCAFEPRCPRASDLCGRTAPPLAEAPGGRRFACHHPLSGPSPSSEASPPT